MIKPDGVRRGLIGEIINRFERRGLKIVALKMVKMDRKTAELLYEEHKGKSFFEDLINYVTSGPVVCMVIEGEDAVQVVRRMIGNTDPKEAPPGTIRGDFALSKSENIIHASDSLEKAKREMSIFFDTSNF
jgi:nucleoside-diphosphate kinase